MMMKHYGPSPRKITKDDAEKFADLNDFSIIKNLDVEVQTLVMMGEYDLAEAAEHAFQTLSTKWKRETK